MSYKTVATVHDSNYQQWYTGLRTAELLLGRKEIATEQVRKMKTGQGKTKVCSLKSTACCKDTLKHRETYDAMAEP